MSATIITQPPGNVLSNPGLWTLDDLRRWDTPKLRWALENIHTVTTPLIDGKFASLGDVLDALRERGASTAVTR